MKMASVHDLIADTIPQLFASDCGPYESELFRDLATSRGMRFFSLAPISEALQDFTKECFEIWERLRPSADWQARQDLEQEWMQQNFAENWLMQRTGINGWSEIIDYFRRLHSRTRENHSVRKNIVIDHGMAPEEAMRLDD